MILENGNLRDLKRYVCLSGDISTALLADISLDAAGSANLLAAGT